MNRKILIVLLLTIGINLQGQKLKPKGKLGIYLAQAESNTFGATYAVGKVLPNSTAENLGLKENDIILEVNGKTVNTPLKISQVVGKFIAGESAEALVLREGKEVFLQGRIMAPPPFTKPNQALDLLEVPFRSGYVRAYLNRPEGEGPFPTIYYLQGYPCQSINSHPESPTMQLVYGLVDLGYAVFRIEKPGIGEYIDLDPCDAYSFDDEVENFRGGLAFLKQLKQVDPEQVYLFGHSLGGHVAPLLAQNKEVAGTMVYGTKVKSWEDYMIDMVYYSFAYSGNAAQVYSLLPTLKSAVSKIYAKEFDPASLTSDEIDLLKSWHQYDEDGHLFARKIDFWRNLNQKNFIEAWSKVDVPVLALYGEHDVHAIGPLDSRLIARIVNQQHDKLGKFKLVEHTNHLFARVESRAQELDHIHRGLASQMAMKNFNTQLPQIIDEWIQASKDLQKEYLFEEDKVSLPIELTKLSSMDVITEDLDHDGLKDLVIATEYGPNLLFLRQAKKWVQKPLPELKNYQAPYLGEDSEDVLAADFDKDGDIDLFFVSEDTQNHELLINDGKANFSIAEHQIAKGGQANAVLKYDFNADGLMDILIGIRGRNEIYINQGDMKFLNSTDQYWGSNEDHTQDLIAVDVDNDGDLDIVEGNEAGGNNLYLNEQGRLIEHSDRLMLSEEIETRKVIAVDVEGDGDTDLFFCNVGWQEGKDAQNILLINDGKGQFKPAQNSLPADPSSTLDALFMDLNQDQVIDLITTNFVHDKRAQVYLGEPFGSGVKFTADDGIIPTLNYYGGTSIIGFEEDDRRYLYFANFKSEDVLLKEVAHSRSSGLNAEGDTP